MRVFVPEWDVRNLGVDCLECVVEPMDSVVDVSNRIMELVDCPYVTIRVPPVKIDLIKYFENKGFRLAEVSMNLFAQWDSLLYPKFLKRRIDLISWKDINDDELIDLKHEISKGMFLTDRFSLDPLFGVDVAARRYNNWIDDMVKQGHRPAYVYLGSECIGFFLICRESKLTYRGILSGVFNGLSGKGLGIIVQYAIMAYIKDHGAKTHDAYCSLNNPEVWRTLSSLGFKLKEMNYVLIKHDCAEKEGRILYE